MAELARAAQGPAVALAIGNNAGADAIPHYNSGEVLDIAPGAKPLLAIVRVRSSFSSSTGMPKCSASGAACPISTHRFEQDNM
jgi:hypothetical protein